MVVLYYFSFLRPPTTLFLNNDIRGIPIRYLVIGGIALTEEDLEFDLTCKSRFHGAEMYTGSRY